MAGAWPLIRALAADRNRGFRAYGSAAKNNLAMLALALAFASPMTASLVLAVLCLPMLVATQRERAAGRTERLGLLPLTRMERRLLSASRIALEPLAWVLFGLALLGGLRVWPLVLALLTVAALGRALFSWSHHRSPGRVQAFHRPLPGRFGPLLAGFIRPFLCTLDFHAALLLSLAGTVYRFTASQPAPAALAGISLLVVVAFSTCAQTLFADEGAEGFARYRLLPLPGWKLLLLKDAAFLAVLVPLLLPLAPATGLAAAFAALAVGHSGSVSHVHRQAPWHFRRGFSYGFNLVQGTALASMGVLVHSFGPLASLPVMLLLATSIAWYGRSLDRSSA